MAKPQMIGSINCYITTRAQAGKVKFTYDGTTKGLTRAAVARGVTVGSVIETGLGTFRLIDAAHDDRAGGYWCSRVWTDRANRFGA